MTPKHKKHKIILKYIIINSANSSDKEENLKKQSDERDKLHTKKQI